MVASNPDANPQPIANLDQTLHAIEDLAAEEGHQVRTFSAWTSHFERIEAITDNYVNTRLGTVNPEEVDDLVDRIKARREKLSLSTGVTSQIVSICQQILAFGAAGVALTVGFIDKIRQFSIIVQKSLAIIGIFYSELMILSLLVLVWYMLQARFRYPSLYLDKIGNAWPFFYYASITPVCRAPVQTPQQRFRAATKYAGDFASFTNRVLSENPTERLRAELQQYFLLMSYQAYNHQFGLRLANLFTYGFVGALGTAAILFGLLFGGRL